MKNAQVFDQEQAEALLDVKGMGRATSYTEVYKKKVHVPSSGKGPQITIEVPNIIIISREKELILLSAFPCNLF